VAAYIIGSIPTGYLICRWRAGLDLRQSGSGNIGATNVARTLGVRWGVLVLLLDMAKGALPVSLALLLGYAQPESRATWAALAGSAAFLGHIYSLFLHFRGGKGVATAFGVSLLLMPQAALAALAIFSFVCWKWRYVSLASLLASLSLVFWAALFNYPRAFLALTILFALLITIRHRENLSRLRQGREHRW